jgi:ankyrin repeat protein|tara:strand:- start:1876 stop:2121 length:246 start_codon:yes stop_codon:yes gene_type:complete
MEHPFINESTLSEKSIEELQESISSLTTKLSFSSRTGNQSVTNQILMAIESHRTVMQKKLNALFNKENIKDQIHIESGKTR